MGEPSRGQKPVAICDKNFIIKFNIIMGMMWIRGVGDPGGPVREGVSVWKKKLKSIEVELEAPADFTSPDVLYEDLVKSIRKYHPSDDLGMVEKAYQIARDAHKDQKRENPGSHISSIPSAWRSSWRTWSWIKESIIAGILHDVVEDTVLTEEELAAIFGKEVALLVDGVTKLTQLSWSADKVEMQAENLRKMFLAMAKDIRVILIKLADRLHNMRTLQYMKPEKQKEKARETIEIYAPLADRRLGISKIKIELDDLALKYLEPDVYNDLQEKISPDQRGQTEFHRRDHPGDQHPHEACGDRM